jgi:hypothetical protein
MREFVKKIFAKIYNPKHFAIICFVGFIVAVLDLISVLRGFSLGFILTFLYFFTGLIYTRSTGGDLYQRDKKKEE